VQTAIAQTPSDAQLASQYYQGGEYDKALIYYDKLYEKQPNDFYYQYLLKCYLQMEDYKGGEKLIKKHLKTNNLPKYKVDLGSIYEATQNQSKAKQLYEKTIKNLEPDQQQIIQLANAFVQKGKNEYALQTYLKARKLIRHYPYNIEIAKIYAAQRKHDAMIKEYVSLLEINPSYQVTVQNALLNTISFEKGNKESELLKSELIKMNQKNPSKEIYAEMLIWVYIQMQNFNGALIQAKALDKRLNEDGTRVMHLAEIALTNEKYDIAASAFNYVIDKGNKSYFYIDAKMSLLKCLQTKITSTPDYTKEDLTTLETKYEETIEELGESFQTAPIIRELAQLQAYYLNKIEEAVANLENLLTIRNVDRHLKAQCKLDLGDFLVIKDEIWDASLYYSQVDKDFKYDILGQIAKFKRAKTWYYTGHFKRAKGELDVLKGSTSKLIANDALWLSNLITDNTGIDTTEIPMQLFAKADLLWTQNKDSFALETMDSITRIYPDHSLSDDILYQKYKMFYKRQKFEISKKYLEELLENYGDDILADNALFSLAELYQNVFKDDEKAMELYQKLLFDYKGSLFTVEARKRFRELRGDKIN
jgi:tetratricopeptide (TPR) repeat protein